MNNIDILEEFIKINFLYGKISFTDEQFKKYQQAILNLIAENKELKEEKRGLEIKASELNGLAEVLQKDYISKSKVEEKIKELKDDMLSSGNLDEFYKKQYAYTVLRHLIYEENKNE